MTGFFRLYAGRHQPMVRLHLEAHLLKMSSNMNYSLDKLTSINEQKEQTNSSREIAELTGKEHKHVMRDIRDFLEQGVDEPNFGLGSYKDAQNQVSVHDPNETQPLFYENKFNKLYEIAIK